MPPRKTKKTYVSVCPSFGARRSIKTRKNRVKVAGTSLAFRLERLPRHQLARLQDVPGKSPSPQHIPPQAAGFPPLPRRTAAFQTSPFDFRFPNFLNRPPPRPAVRRRPRKEQAPRPPRQMCCQYAGKTPTQNILFTAGLFVRQIPQSIGGRPEGRFFPPPGQPRRQPPGSAQRQPPRDTDRTARNETPFQPWPGNGPISGVRLYCNMKFRICKGNCQLFIKFRIFPPFSPVRMPHYPPKSPESFSNLYKSYWHASDFDW